VDAGHIVLRILTVLSVPYLGRSTWETRSAISIMIVVTVGCALALVLFD
jgi:hypothetical protein